MSKTNNKRKTPQVASEIDGTNFINAPISKDFYGYY